MLKLQLGKTAVGTKVHRCGWPYAMRALQLLHSNTGVFCEDFVERQFGWEKGGRPICVPWVGFAHNPHDQPFWWQPDERPQWFTLQPQWSKSEPNLQLLFVLSDYLAGFYRERLSCPVVALRHPTEIPDLTWRPEFFLANKDRKVIQIGYWVRNLQALYQLPPIPGYTKMKPLYTDDHIKRLEAAVWGYWQDQGTRPIRDTAVELYRRFDDDAYDVLLSRNVMFLELLGTSANNAVIECVARNTPLIVNRHPAVEEYLGKDYPLFYDHFEEAEGLFTDDKILAAYEYLTVLDKTWLSGAAFRLEVRKALTKHLGLSLVTI